MGKRKFFKKVTKDNHGKRLEDLKTVTVRDAVSVSNKKVMVYTNDGTYNIAEDLKNILVSRGKIFSEGRRKIVCQKLKNCHVHVSGETIVDLHKFVY